MVTFKETISRTIVKAFEKDDIEGYKVVGNATYNKNNKLADANGSVREGDSIISNFNIYGEGENTRINLTDCLAGRMSDAVSIAKATLADLAASYPEE